MTVTLRIAGMNCQHCVNAVTEALSTIAGLRVLEVTVGTARVEAEEAPDEAALRRALDDAGFDLAGVDPASR